MFLISFQFPLLDLLIKNGDQEQPEVERSIVKFMKETGKYLIVRSFSMIALYR